MAEDSSEDETRTTRRGWLAGALAAVGLGALIGHELTKPNPYQEQARKLWNQYQQNPDKFIQDHRGVIDHNLIAGPNGTNLRKAPGNRKDDESLIGYLPPQQEIGTALHFSNPTPTSLEIFLTREWGDQMVFFSQLETEQKTP